MPILEQQSKSSKINFIKHLIRKHHYKDNNKVFDECQRMGMSVNFDNLTRFAEKLELLDRVERKKRNKEGYVASISEMSYEEVKIRETEITFELGALRIQENKLMEELYALSLRISEKH